MNWKWLSAGAIAVLVLGAASVAYSYANGMNLIETASRTLGLAEPQSETFARDGIAIKGADPVAYFEQDAYVPGSSEYTHEWQEATWQFSSAENRDLFAQNPEQYAPEYGGYCAWAISQGRTAPIDPTAWTIVDGKLYLNFNAMIQKRWEKDIPGFITLANENWPEVLN